MFAGPLTLGFNLKVETYNTLKCDLTCDKFAGMPTGLKKNVAMYPDR
jgi:hypothetical protein